MIIQENENGIRIEGIPDIYKVREELKVHGYFDPSFTFFTIKNPFEVTFKTTWWPTAVDVSIKKKPFLVPARLIFERLRQEVEKATVPV
jgi:hypothetical protein